MTMTDGTTRQNRTARPRVGRWQFSLRAFFVLLFLLAVLAWLVVAKYRGKEQALARLAELGASVSFDFQWSKSEAWKPDVRIPGNRRLQYLLGKHYAAKPVEIQLFASPSMSPERFTDDDAEMLATIPSIKWLVLQDTRLSDTGLMHLLAISSLERLDVEGTAVMRQGVQAFQAARPNVKVFY